METVTAVKDRMRSLVSSLHKSLECPVCLETLKSPFKVCGRGHGVCLECMTKLEKCPLCEGSFVLENLVCLKNVLEALPHLCRYSDAGCDEIVEPGNDHEMFCGYRPILCPCCSVKFPLSKILDHYEKQHEKDFIFTDEENEDINSALQPALNYYTPVSLFNNLFWVYEINDPTENQYKIFFKATPIGKLEHDYYVCVTFKKGKVVYTYTLKAQVLSSCEGMFDNEQFDEEYCMKVPQKELHNFTDNKGRLHCSFNFFEM